MRSEIRRRRVSAAIAYNWANSGGGDFKSIVKSIPNLRFWFSAPYEVKIDGDLIGTPVDQSGNGVTITSPADARRPTFKTNIINGKPVYRFDGTTDCWQGIKTDFDFLHQGSNTVIVVFIHRAAETAVIFSNCVDSNNIGRVIRSAGALGFFTDGCFAASPGNDIFSIQSANGTLPINNAHIVVVRYDRGKVAADDYEGYIDNLPAIPDSGTINPSAATSTNIPTIGAHSSFANRLNGDIADLMAFDRALTNEEINKIVGGLNFGS